MSHYHKCGHPAIPKRYLDPEKIARVLCDPCRAVYAERNKTARSESAARGLLPLRGNTAQQIAWATTLRLEALLKLEAADPRLTEWLKVRSASWWIRRR